MSDSDETTNEDPWLTTGEAAAILGVSLPTVRRMTESGKLVSERVASWSSKGADRLGRPLPGHRRVSRESVERAGIEAAKEQAERARRAGVTAERHIQTQVANLETLIADIDRQIVDLTAKRETYRARVEKGQSLAKIRVANIDGRIADLVAKREERREALAEQNRTLAKLHQNLTPDTLDT